MTDKRFDWESNYGFTAMNVHSNEELAATLEQLRRQVCVYGGGDFCDCKYGLKAEGTTQDWMRARGERRKWHGEQTGCPELRELIHRLLYRPETFQQDTLF